MAVGVLTGHRVLFFEVANEDAGRTVSSCLLLAAATGYVALYGTPMLQVGFAAGLVWLLLFGGVRDTATAGRQKGTDPHHL